MRFHPPTKTPLGSAFAINMPSGDLGTEKEPKKEPEPQGAHVHIAFRGQNPLVITAAEAKEFASWVTSNAGKIVPAAP